MALSNKGSLVILSGPSCVGKGPLFVALERFCPHLAQNLRKLVLYNSRSPRPGETEGIDYYFRSREEIEELRNKKDFLVLNVRGDLQGLDLSELRTILDQGHDAFFEGNPFVPRAIWQLPVMDEVPMKKVFLSPLSLDEIQWLKKQKANLRELVVDVMRRKLLRRTQKQKRILSLKDLENIEQRAQSAPLELDLAWYFDWVIPNHDGEDSDNWNAFYYPLGDAYKSLINFAAILEDQNPPDAEKWEKGLWV